MDKSPQNNQKLNIVFTDTINIHPDFLPRILALSSHPVVGSFITFTDLALEDIPIHCKDADIIITVKSYFPGTTLEALPRLRYIGVLATGTDRIDLATASIHGITIANVPAYSTTSVAELALSLALALNHRLPYFASYTSSPSYAESHCFTHFLTPPPSSLALRKWGIIGYGAIGRYTASLARAFGALTYFYSRSGTKDFTGLSSYLPLDALLSTCDIISIHAPLSPETYHLLSTERLSLLKSDAVLINVARGGIVDEAALAAIMHTTSISYGSDVLEVEPPISSRPSPIFDPLLRDRVIVTPHIGWATSDSLDRLVTSAIASLTQFLDSSALR